ncbi:filensin [Gracilinanus agilis]|uniref:filensin n=1 Tax=Gracilinanus agilis TaxID=191870 RepID=UPI001CFEC98C|nr:filensin [Gracilinanus agilis]
MYRSTYLRETRKEKYERADELHGSGELSSLGQAQGLEHLQELNERFANYINWARGLEQRNAIFRKQLETFQRLDELASLEEAFSEQIELNLQRARDLAIDRAKLEREDKDAQRVLDEFRNKFQEKLIAERRVPILQSQLEEYKGILAQLQMQKSKLQAETVTLEQTIKHTQESYDDEIQLYNEQIETLRKEIEDAERMLEKYTNDCRQLAIYQQSLENELERYKRIIENEDNRLNSAIVGTPITLFTQSYQASYNLPSSRKDITRAMQDITTVKPRQKGLPKKASRKKEITAKDKADETLENQPAKKSIEGKDQGQLQDEQQSKLEVRPGEAGTLKQELAPEDVPDGARLSKAFGKMCNIIKERVRSDKVPEPHSDLYTKGRYVLVTGDASYVDPDFCSSSIPAKGGIVVSIDQMSEEDDVEPVPGLPEPPCPNGEDDPQEYDGEYKNQEHAGDVKDESKNRDQRKVGEKTDDISKEKEAVKPCPVVIPGPNDHSVVPSQKNKKDKATEAADKGLPEKGPHGSMTYEKVEVVESIEKFSTDRIQTYEETAVIVETMIEKTNRKKLGDKSS